MIHDTFLDCLSASARNKRDAANTTRVHVLLSHLLLHEDPISGVEADDEEDDQDVARDLKHREARGELKQFTRNSGGKAVVERFLGDVDLAISRQNKLEGGALPLITQQHQQNGNLSDVFPERIYNFLKHNFDFFLCFLVPEVIFRAYLIKKGSRF